MSALNVSHPSYVDKMSKFRRAGNPVGNSSLNFSNDDEKFWWDSCSDLLAEVLTKAGYNEELQLQFLNVYQKVITAFGPRALHDGQASRFSPMSLDSTPFELGWTHDGSASTIGMGFEPYGPPNDPFAQSTAKALVHELAKLPNTQVDLQLFDAIADTMWVSSDHRVSVQEKLPKDPKAQRPCHIAMGYAMSQNGSITIKAYVTSQVKMLESLLEAPGASQMHAAVSHHGTQNNIATRLVRTLDSKFFKTAPLLPAYKIIEECTALSPKDSQQVVFMFGWDCAKLSETRLKVYVHKEKTTLNNLRNLWTQGGKLTGPSISQGLEIIDELWPLLYNVPEGASADYELKTWYGVSHPMVACFEIKPGSAQPTPKLYLEPGRFGRSDLETGKRLSGWYEKRGWSLGKTWADDIQSIFSHLNLNETKGMHSTFCVSPQSNEDLKVTMYLNPLVHTALSSGS